MLEDNISLAKERRRTRFESACFLNKLSTPESTPDNDLSWSSLLDIPEWCQWPNQEQRRLLLVSGALFSAPVIRLWIDSDRIKKARLLIGDNTFQLVLKNNIVPNSMQQLVHDEDVEDLFLATGASVLLGSTPTSLNHYVGNLLPKPAGKLPLNIAQLVFSEALVILSQINKLNEPEKPEKAVSEEGLS